MNAMEVFKLIADCVALAANIFTVLASGIAIYLFFSKRDQFAQAFKLLLNFSFQMTLGEVKEKLERLNEYNANEPSEQAEIANILHEIAGQIRGNPRLKILAPHIPKRLEGLAAQMTEPKKRSMVAELRELMRNTHLDTIDPAEGKSRE